MFAFFHTVLSDHFNVVVTCWDRADLLALSIWCPESGVVIDLIYSRYFPYYKVIQFCKYHVQNLQLNQLRHQFKNMIETHLMS